MPQTVILVDLENVQLQVDDLRGLVRGQHQLKIFHGPSQNKLTMDLVRALQPLGDAVAYIQCEKAGPNALDFHLAFHLGRLSALQPDDAYVIVSRDKGFAQLVSHGIKLGHHIRQVPRLVIGESGGAGRTQATDAPPAPRAARKSAARKTAAAPSLTSTGRGRKRAAAAVDDTPGASPQPAPRPTGRGRKRAADPVPVVPAPPAVEPKAARKSTRKAAPSQATTREATPPSKAVPTKSPSRRTAAPGASTARDVASDSDVAQAVASLRKMGAKRPTRLSALTHHLQSHLRTELSLAGIAHLLDRLAAAGYTAVNGGKLSYPALAG